MKKVLIASRFFVSSREPNMLITILTEVETLEDWKGLLLILYMVFLFYAFTVGRRWRHYYATKKLIKDLEKHFGDDLPYYKKQRDQKNLNWERVLQMLRKEPTTPEVARLKEQVKKRVGAAVK
jgi:hypothetical protein